MFINFSIKHSNHFIVNIDLCTVSIFYKPKVDILIRNANCVIFNFANIDI